ncbi:MAG: hypothetical protein CMH30_00830 [Micavibrio sp.]|nr:hypothetical protein [Micavibrio sp.]
MKIQRTHSTTLDFGDEVYINTYVSSWSKYVELKFCDSEPDGTDHKIELRLPLDKARALLKELSEDLGNYDKEQASKLEMEKEEATDE